jgi:hypothetical protein
MNNLTYLIIPVSELSKVVFDDIYETSINTLRLSTNMQKTIIKWEGDTPLFVSNINNAEGPYTNSEISTIMSTSEWFQPIL